jgi:hypothetical protein
MTRSNEIAVGPVIPARDQSPFFRTPRGARQHNRSVHRAGVVRAGRDKVKPPYQREAGERPVDLDTVTEAELEPRPSVWTGARPMDRRGQSRHVRRGPRARPDDRSKHLVSRSPTGWPDASSMTSSSGDRQLGAACAGRAIVRETAEKAIGPVEHCVPPTTALRCPMAWAERTTRPERRPKGQDWSGRTPPFGIQGLAGKR